VDEKLLAEYGEAILRLEVEQAKLNDVKRRVI
jgi:hypothetical protein